MRAEVSFYADKNVKVGFSPKNLRKMAVNLNDYMTEYKIERGTLGYLHKVKFDGVPQDVDVDQAIRCKLLHDHVRKLKIDVYGGNYKSPNEI